MAKGRGQISEEELASGLARVGSMSGLTSSSRPKRDNPFATVEDTVKAAPESKSVEEKVIRESAKTVEVSLDQSKEIVDSEPVAGGTPASSRRVAARSIAPQYAQQEEVVPTKAELYPERVTTPMSQEMRAQLDALSRELQRIRTSKGDRITTASVIRVAIQTFLESFEPTGVGGEEELLEYARKQFGLSQK